MLNIHKPGQGMSSRVGAVVLGLLLGFYAGYCWYWWLFPGGETLLQRVLTAGFLGGIILFLGLSGLAIYLALLQATASDYLIDMDGELRKVVWPATQPLFDPKTDAWGSTYVVIACTILFTVFIGVVDWCLHHTISMGLLKLLFPGKGV